MKLMCKPVIAMILMANLFGVYWTPEIPTPGGEITIYYNTIEGTLANNTNPVYIHIGHSGWQGVDDYAMTYEPSLGNGWWSFVYPIAEDAETIDFVFTDLLDNWDNNGGFGIDWHISLNYYWTPFSPGPNSSVEVLLNGTENPGSIVWTVNDGSGFDVPIENYRPVGTTEIGDLPWSLGSVGSWVSSPLSYDDDSQVAELGPFNLGEQIVESIKFAILWEDGTWDAGSNGQILFYDISMDYEIGVDDPNVIFIAPTPENGTEVSPPITINAVGNAVAVEFWLNGEIIGSDNTLPFSTVWSPIDGAFGDYTIVTRAVGENDRVSFSFLDYTIPYEVIDNPVPAGISDGLNMDGNQITIALYAPDKEFVSVKGSWNTAFPNGELMYLSGDTLWWYETTLENGQYNYQYNIEGLKNLADPWSKDVDWVDPNAGWESGYYGHAKTVFTVGQTDYSWTDEDFTRPAQNEAVIYELHIGDFAADSESHGTFNDVTTAIQEGYFDNLGVNAIELMPVNEFEGGYSWGYDSTFPMAPESSYGTPDDLKNLINTAHEHDIAVLIDVVFNHLWGSSPLFQLYQPADNYEYEDHDYSNCPYFSNALSDWGYKLNHWSPRTRKFTDDVLFTWVNDYHADGFRFDYTPGVGWDSQSEFGATHYSNMLDWIDPTLILIAEEDNANQVNITGFDSGWDYSYHHTLFANIVAVNHEGHWWGDMDDMVNHIDAFSQGYNDHTGQLIYSESHDEGRIVHEATIYQGDSEAVAYSKSLLGAAVMLTSEGTPMLYHGQEFGQNGTSHEGEHISPQPLQWENLDTETGGALFNKYANLIDLRKNSDALKGHQTEFKFQNSQDKSLVYWRVSGDDKVVVIANFDSQTHYLDVEFPHGGEWYNVIDETVINIESNWYGGFQANAHSAYVFSLPPEESCVLGDVSGDGAINVLDVVQVVNYVLNVIEFNDDQICSADMNVDGTINVLDIVTLVNYILNN